MARDVLNVVARHRLVVAVVGVLEGLELVPAVSIAEPPEALRPRPRLVVSQVPPGAGAAQAVAPPRVPSVVVVRASAVASRSVRSVKSSSSRMRRALAE